MGSLKINRLSYLNIHTICGDDRTPVCVCVCVCVLIFKTTVRVLFAPMKAD